MPTRSPGPQVPRATLQTAQAWGRPSREGQLGWGWGQAWVPGKGPWNSSRAGPGTKAFSHYPPSPPADGGREKVSEGHHTPPLARVHHHRLALEVAGVEVKGAGAESEDATHNWSTMAEGPQVPQGKGRAPSATQVRARPFMGQRDASLRPPAHGAPRGFPWPRPG